MATAVMPARAVTAQRLEPGIAEAKLERNPVLPPQGPEEIGGSQIFQSELRAWFLPTDEMPNPRPSRVHFAALRDPCLRMVQAIPLDVSVEESNIVVCWSETNEFGTGDTLGGAMDDFAGALRDLYHQLFASDANLGADLQQVKQIVERYIQPRK